MRNEGSPACLRDVHIGQVLFAWPVVASADGDTILAAQLAGAVGMVPEGYPDDLARVMEQAAARRWSLVERAWSWTNCLHVLQPDQWWTARLMWSADSGDFLCWYVDFRVPVVRRGAMIDTCDLHLDVVVLPDGSWSWKDEDHFALAVDAGHVSEAERAGVEAARDEVVDAIETGRFPFDGSYLDWAPAAVAVPDLPPDWAQV